MKSIYDFVFSASVPGHTNSKYQGQEGQTVGYRRHSGNYSIKDCHNAVKRKYCYSPLSNYNLSRIRTA